MAPLGSAEPTTRNTIRNILSRQRSSSDQQQQQQQQQQRQKANSPPAVPPYERIFPLPTRGAVRTGGFTTFPTTTTNTAAAPRATTSNTSQNGTVKFTVGPDRTTYNISRNLLISNGGAALLDFPKDRHDAIRLKTLKPKQFEIATYFLNNNGTLSDDTHFVNHEGRYTESNYIDLYSTAQKLKLHKMQNHIMDHIWARYAKKPKKSRTLTFLIKHVKNDLKGTPLYDFTLRSGLYALMSGTLSNATWKDNLKDLEAFPEVMRDLLYHIGKWAERPWDRPGSDRRCDYHLHPGGEARCTHDPRSDDMLISRYGSGPGQADDDADSEDGMVEETVLEDRNGNGNGNGQPEGRGVAGRR